MNDIGVRLLYSIEDLAKEVNSIEKYLGGEEMKTKQKRNLAGMHYLNQSALVKTDKIKKIAKIKQEKNNANEREKKNIPV